MRAKEEGIPRLASRESRDAASAGDSRDKERDIVIHAVTLPLILCS